MPAKKKHAESARARKSVAAKPSRSTAPIPEPRPDTVADLPAYQQPTNKSAATTAMPRTLPSSWKIAERSLRLLHSQWRLFVALLTLYGILNVLTVHTLSNLGAQALKNNAGAAAFKSAFGALGGGINVFQSMIFTATSNPSDSSGAYQFMLLLIMSLATIWLLRKSKAVLGKPDEELGRSAFRYSLYRGMYPFVPFFLLLLLIIIELIPFLVAASLYSTVLGNSIANGLLPQLIFLCLALIGGCISAYWLSVSVPALYIVTLPDMEPFEALDNAKQLVKGRRFAVARKILFLPFALFVMMAVVTVPLIIVWAWLAQVVFFVMVLACLPLVNAYLYVLYLELINE